MEIQASYQDGRSTRSTPVVARVNASAGSLELEGLPAALSVPLGEVRVSPRIGDTVRSLWLPNGATCETRDQEAADALAARLGQGAGARLLHQLESRWSSRLAAVALVIGIAWGALAWLIPALARYLAHAMPAEAARHFGQGTLTVLDHTVFSPSRLSASQRVQVAAGFAPLAQAYPGLPLNLQFRSGFGLNALSLPDGTLVLSDRLVEVATEPEQIVGVLAHEVGHVYHRHALTALLAGSTSALLLAAYVADLTQISDWTLWLPATLIGSNFSRVQETEADDFALNYLRQAGIAPRHLADMFRIFEKELGSESGAAARYLSTHPMTAERIQRFDSER